MLNKTSKYLIAGLSVIVVALLIWQFAGYQKQVVRHQNALRFWQVEVPKVQQTYPNFKPVDVEARIAEENAQFNKQKNFVYLNCGLIIMGGLLGMGLIYFYPRKNNGK